MKDTSYRSDNDDKGGLEEATLLMRRALHLLDAAGEARSAAHLQHALDTLPTRLPRTIKAIG